MIYGTVAAAATGSLVAGQVGDADHDFGPPVPPPPQRIKEQELELYDAGDIRSNPFWMPLSQVKPSLLTADPKVAWACSVAEGRAGDPGQRASGPGHR